MCVVHDEGHSATPRQQDKLGEGGCSCSEADAGNRLWASHPDFALGASGAEDLDLTHAAAFPLRIQS
jgi:hypothetical protein